MTLRRAARRGNQAIEFALLLPLLVLLGGGLIDTANYLGAQQALVAAVQDGTRHGATYDWRPEEDPNLTTDEATAAADTAWGVSSRHEEAAFVSNLMVINDATIIQVRGRITIDTFFSIAGFPDTLEYSHHMRLDKQPPRR